MQQFQQNSPSVAEQKLFNGQPTYVIRNKLSDLILRDSPIFWLKSFVFALLADKIPKI